MFYKQLSKQMRPMVQKHQKEAAAARRELKETASYSDLYLVALIFGGTYVVRNSGIKHALVLWDNRTSLGSISPYRSGWSGQLPLCETPLQNQRQTAHWSKSGSNTIWPRVPGKKEFRLMNLARLRKK